MSNSPEVEMTNTIREIMDLTEEEQDVLMLLVDAWNGFVRLPWKHPDDISEFRQIIHEAQRMILSRPTLRKINQDDPEGAATPLPPVTLPGSERSPFSPFVKDDGGKWGRG